MYIEKLGALPHLPFPWHPSVLLQALAFSELCYKPEKVQEFKMEKM